MQRIFQSQRRRDGTGRLAMAVAAAANVVPVVAWRQRTATETVTAGNAARNGAKVLGFREGPTFGGWVQRRVPARTRLRRIEHQAHHAGLPHLAVLHRMQDSQKALADVRSQKGQSIQELTIRGPRADQHRRHGHRRGRGGIARPLVAGTGVVGLIKVPRGAHPMDEPEPDSGPAGTPSDVSQAPPGDGKVSDIADPGTEGAASAAVSAAARAASSSSEMKKLAGKSWCA